MQVPKRSILFFFCVPRSDLEFPHRSRRLTCHASLAVGRSTRWSSVVRIETVQYIPRSSSRLASSLVFSSHSYPLPGAPRISRPAFPRQRLTWRHKSISMSSMLRQSFRASRNLEYHGRRALSKYICISVYISMLPRVDLIIQ